MRARIGEGLLDLIQGDITKERVDALVTAANSALAGGGGVDGAIHRAAGPSLLAACQAIGGCPTGGAVATPAGNLPVKRIIHAVGPIYGRNQGKDDQLLASAHRQSLELAAAEGSVSIAFPAISCGVYGFPVEQAATIALRTIRDALLSSLPIRHVRYCLFSDSDLQVFTLALQELASEDPRVVLERHEA